MRRNSEIDLRDDTGVRSKMHALQSWGAQSVPRQGTTFVRWRIRPAADKPGVPEETRTFKQCDEHWGTNLQRRGTMQVV